VYGDEDSYFERLGQLDRLRWIVHEVYIRQTYGVKMIDDTSFESIFDAKSAHRNISVDPPNFNILANQTYQQRLGYTPIHFQDSQVQQK
jgi:hypothetical protein